jgi:PAS domain-containing protein
MNDEEIDFTNPKMLRKLAEEKLKTKQSKIDKAHEEADVKKLVHELQVHQIELEMQNEELRQAYDTAETALKKYTMLYDLAPMGYFTIDSDGIIKDLNFTGADMLGEKRFTLVNSNFKLFVFEDSLPSFNNFLTKVFDSNAKESCEVVLVNDKNPLCFVYIEGVVIGDEKLCLLSVVDISGLKKLNKP